MKCLQNQVCEVRDSFDSDEDVNSRASENSKMSTI